MLCKPVADPDQAFGGQSNRGRQNVKYPSFSVTIVGYHINVFFTGFT